jgi:hypothetical protein
MLGVLAPALVLLVLFEPITSLASANGATTTPGADAPVVR